jgi:hypothetical protein
MPPSDELAKLLIGVSRAYDAAVDLSSLLAADPGTFDVEGFVRDWGQRRSAAVRDLAALLEEHADVPEVEAASDLMCAAADTFDRTLATLAQFRSLTPKATALAVSEMSRAYCELQFSLEGVARALRVGQDGLDDRLRVRGYLMSFLHQLARALEANRSCAAGTVASNVR